MTWSQWRQTRREAVARRRRVAFRPGTRLVATSALVACLGVASSGTVAPHTAPAFERCTLESVQARTLERVTVRDVAIVPAGSFRPSATAPPLAGLPAFCRVQAGVATSADSLVNFEIWIPEPWNGKLVVTGNGGYGNVPGYRDMGSALMRGYATAGGDTGHQTPTPDDLLWGKRGADEPAGREAVYTGTGSTDEAASFTCR